MSPLTTLIMAGRRAGNDDLAEATGHTHRALLDVSGVPMLMRVVQTLRASPSVGRIAISIDDPDSLDSLGEIAGIERHRSLASPSASLSDFLGQLPENEPLLVVTADHALLTPEMVEHFIGACAASDADVLVALVESQLLQTRYPETTRTYLRFGNEAFSGANLFAFRTPDARRAAEFWIRAERFRKRPWRLVATFGFVSLLQFALHRLDLDAALTRASQVMGAQVEAVRMPFAEAAIDVDRASDLALVEEILSHRDAGRVVPPPTSTG
ncbi:nucleotidyltransferase family protein [Myxococcota bacterium]|nr:nucleotidyltransferase family protein [Myxococcota bacterium]